jgi:hypothetical protein
MLGKPPPRRARRQRLPAGVHLESAADSLAAPLASVADVHDWPTAPLAGHIHAGVTRCAGERLLAERHPRRPLAQPVELPQVGRRPVCGDRSSGCGSAGQSHSCCRAAAWRMRRSVQARARGPYDLSGAPARVDKDHGFGSQLPGRLRPPPSKVPADGFRWVRTECSRQRASEAIDPPARITSRITGIAAELRGAEVACPAPPRRERPAIKLGVEGPDIEVLDTVPPVDVVTAAPWHSARPSRRPAYRPRALQVSPEELGFGVSGQLGKAPRISQFDAGD